MYRKGIKRILDIFLSGIALVILSPILLLVSLLVLLDDFGPVFFGQQRVGRHERIFKIYKFRTMCIDAEKYQKVGAEVIGRDSRITKVGYILRRFKIDEIPQLINILKGDMSIVGPRPTLPDYLEAYEEWERKRFLVRPGLSGLAQVNGNIYLSKTEKSRFDVEYVEKYNLGLDMKIVIKTILVIIMGEEYFKK